MSNFTLSTKIEAGVNTYVAPGNYEMVVKSVHLYEAEEGLVRLLVNLTTDEAEGEVPTLSLTVQDDAHPEREKGGLGVLRTLCAHCGVDTAGALEGQSFPGYVTQNVDEETGEVFSNSGVARLKPTTVAVAA